jgi:hypothetical protein
VVNSGALKGSSWFTSGTRRVTLVTNPVRLKFLICVYLINTSTFVCVCINHIDFLKFLISGTSFMKIQQETISGEEFTTCFKLVFYSFPLVSSNFPYYKYIVNCDIRFNLSLIHKYSGTSFMKIQQETISGEIF